MPFYFWVFALSSGLWDTFGMRTQTEAELDLIINEMGDLAGFEIRQFRYNEKAFQIQFSNGSTLWWLTFSLKPGNPYIFATDERLHLVKSLKKPLGQFFKTHFIGLSVEKLQRLANKGRVLEIQLGGGLIELLLVPGRVNIELRAEGKVVFAFKPSPLKEHDSEMKQNLANSQKRNAQFFFDLWQSRMSKTQNRESQDLEKTLRKKKEGLLKMQERLEQQQESEWESLGEFLKNNQSLFEVPEPLAKKINHQESLSWNIENAFNQSKKNKAKWRGTLTRIEALKQEIADLERGGASSKRKAQRPSLLQQAKLKGRTLSLAEGRLFIGKSGKENLQLLRKAKPWYFWLHIKDYPGAYGILERNKGQNISHSSLLQASLAVARQSLPKGADGYFEVLYAECRYVRPIKGAKSGQVTYSNEKIITVKVEG